MTDVLAPTVPESLILACLFGCDAFRTRDELLGWLLFLDRYRFPWREMCEAPPSLASIDASW